MMKSRLSLKSPLSIETAILCYLPRDGAFRIFIYAEYNIRIDDELLQRWRNIDIT